MPILSDGAFELGTPGYVGDEWADMGDGDVRGHPGQLRSRPAVAVVAGGSAGAVERGQSGPTCVRGWVREVDGGGWLDLPLWTSSLGATSQKCISRSLG